jgi:hypothetical protein
MLANECHMTLSTAGEMARGLRAGSSPALPEPVRALADLEFQGNTLLAWTVALAIALGVAFALRLVQGFLVARVLRSASTTRTRLDDVFLDVGASHEPVVSPDGGNARGSGCGRAGAGRT